MSITIRTAEIADAKAISALIVPLVVKYIAPTWQPGVRSILLDSMSEQKIESYLSANYVYLVAVDPDDAIVAVAGMRDDSHLYHLFVADSYQGQGLARQLWLALQKIALHNGNQGRFTVNSALHAEHIYLRFGFKRTEGVRNRDGMVDIPMLLELPAPASYSDCAEI
jgi:GNAT superfamily N-acetyltransferase